MPIKVAMAIPKMPTRIPGTIIELHSFVVAIPQAVVGPPTLAFDAMSNNFRSKPSSLPSPRITARWIAIWKKANINMLGAVLMTLHMFPLAPTTAKNTCKTSCSKLVTLCKLFSVQKYETSSLQYAYSTRNEHNLSWKKAFKSVLF